ncbi:MAG: hypothetical protein ABL962_19100, partial [Fimbriimonadaceae bacterium]
TVPKCQVFLTIIGPHWAQLMQARLNDPDDFVQIEIGLALEAPGVQVIPLLVDGADMPTADALPPRLQPLRTRQAIVLPHDPHLRAAVRKLAQDLVGAAPTPDRPPIPPASEPVASVWSAIRGSLDMRDYAEFIATFPNEPESFLARRHKRQLSEWQAVAKDDIDAVRGFLRDRLFQELKVAVEQVISNLEHEQAEAEERARQEAREAEEHCATARRLIENSLDVSDYRTFETQFSGCPEAAVVGTRRRQLEAYAKTDPNSPTRLRDFLKRDIFPALRTAIESQLEKIEALAEERERKNRLREAEAKTQAIKRLDHAMKKAQLPELAQAMAAAWSSRHTFVVVAPMLAAVASVGLYLVSRDTFRSVAGSGQDNLVSAMAWAVSLAVSALLCLFVEWALQLVARDPSPHGSRYASARSFIGKLGDDDFSYVREQLMDLYFRLRPHASREETQWVDEVREEEALEVSDEWLIIRHRRAAGFVFADFWRDILIGTPAIWFAGAIISYSLWGVIPGNLLWLGAPGFAILHAVSAATQLWLPWWLCWLLAIAVFVVIGTTAAA